MPINFDCEAFVSAPIRLAAKIIERRRSQRNNLLPNEQQQQQQQPQIQAQTQSAPKNPMTIRHARQLPISAINNNSISSKSSIKHTPRALVARAKNCVTSGGVAVAVVLLLISSLWSLCVSGEINFLNNQIISHNQQAESTPAHAMRYHAHYLNFVPFARFAYHEGRQSGARSLDMEAKSASLMSAVAAPQPEVQHDTGSSHIYKRSSAASSDTNPLSRRMMSPTSTGSSSGGSRVVITSNNWLGVVGQDSPVASESLSYRSGGSTKAEDLSPSKPLINSSNESQPSSLSLQQKIRKQSEYEAELLRQKQHIQYHNQWPSMAGKCHKRTLNFCASVLPFNTTTFPNIIGDSNRFEVKRSLPFFGFLAKSSCNKRLDELLCLLLEPPCSPHSGVAIPPCKKFCRLALEGCHEYIPATLALSSVFDCRQYPNSNDPNVCINLTRGSKCAQDEFRCPDKTCIPRDWLCDGVRDCIFAADEANCTVSDNYLGVGGNTGNFRPGNSVAVGPPAASSSASATPIASQLP